MCVCEGVEVGKEKQNLLISGSKIAYLKKFKGIPNKLLVLINFLASFLDTKLTMKIKFCSIG